MTTAPLPELAARSALADYVELTKPRITLMVAVTALVGFVMASPAGVAPGALGFALLGTALVAAGASALNMVLERDIDARMQRTRQRPLPSGRVSPREATAFGLALTACGLLELLWACPPMAAATAALTWASYLFLYTPLKTRTTLSTIVGAVPGALPPMIGWAAARGTLDPGAFVLFAIVFLWQIPHFLAIAWIYREDYARGGLKVLPVLDPEGRVTGRQAVANSLALLVISTTPALARMAGPVYLWGAVALGVAFALVAAAAAVRRTPAAARMLFLVSVLYLPALCGLLLFDRR
jgi:protoheme IX farnesyltransferase